MLHRSRVAQLGAPFAALALASAFLFLPLHGLTTLTHRAGVSAPVRPAITAIGSYSTEDPPHDPGDCPQCQALAQGRAALATAPAPQPVAVTAIGVALLCGRDRLPHDPALATAQPRAPPAHTSIGSV
ncbi:MAG TPA: hypothetical protein DEP35_20385 [Deltaproteobacteria bacterium]|nr:hypothetical protein [Deltaproteobacteria bacterium]